MAERHVWPGVLAGGWRSRPGVVRVAAGLLVLFGLLLVLVEAGEGPLEVVVVVTGLVLLVAAVALVWAGRLGYWLGLTVAALLALLVVVGLTRNPGTGGVVVTALGGLPLLLLLSPAARRPRRTAEPAPASAAAQDELHGWRRPFAGGWGSFALLLVVGGLLTVGGLVLALTGRGAERGAGVTIALFFLACTLAAPLFPPWRRRGRLQLATLRLGQRQERGVLVPYSGWRTAVQLAAIVCLALASLGFVVFADAFADDPGESPWPVRLVGVVGVVFFGAGGFLFARRGWGRRWQVLLTPSAVVIVAGDARTVVPWKAIRQVQATEVTTYVRGFAVREPLLGIQVRDPEAIQTGLLERLLLPLNRRLGADLALPIRTLAIDPRLLYHVLRYYHQHPQARVELATQAGLARVRRGQLTTTQPATGTTSPPGP
jgi:hypothetical protein